MEPLDIKLFDDGVIRLAVYPEQVDYFSVYGDPEGYTKQDGAIVTPDEEKEEIYRLIEDGGLWIVVAQHLCPCCGNWANDDSIGMIIGDPFDPNDNDYINDLVSSARAGRERALKGN